jgi:hypothetical protein
MFDELPELLLPEFFKKLAAFLNASVACIGGPSISLSKRRTPKASDQSFQQNLTIVY